MNSGKSPSVDQHVQTIDSRVTKTWPPRGTSKPRMSLCPTEDQNKREICPAVAVPRRTTCSPTKNCRQQPPLAPLPLLRLGVFAKTVQEGSLPCLWAMCHVDIWAFKGGALAHPGLIHHTRPQSSKRSNYVQTLNTWPPHKLLSVPLQSSKHCVN